LWYGRSDGEAVVSDAIKNLLKVAPLGMVLPLMIGAASVKPDDAVSNLAEWARWFGFHQVPDWLASPSVDQKVIAASILFALAYSGYMWGPNVLKSFRKETPHPIQPPASFPIIKIDRNDTAPDQERVFVDITPAKLMKMYHGRTVLAANALAQPYLGKWMMVTNKLKDIEFMVSNNQIYFVSIGDGKSICSIHLLFDIKWKNRIEVIEIGKNIVAFGRIKTIAATSVTLDECELA
jgi:hypothetical protein